jgi:putative DNA primase/helicase
MFNSENELLDAALAYFAQGRPVIAVRGDTKSPYRKGWNKYFDCAQTEDEVRDFFSNGATAMAKVLFPACNDVHLDFDGQHAIEAWRKTKIKLPHTARMWTQTPGNFQLIFKASALLKESAALTEVKRAIRLVEAGCDCKDPDGKPKVCGVDLLFRGYSLVPPSPGYVEDADFPLEAATEIPDKIVRLAIKRRPKQANSGGGSKDKIKAGKRNATLTSYAGVLRRQGMEYQDIFQALLKKNQNQCDPPLEENEVEQIARSVSRYEPAENGVDAIENLSDLGNAKRFAALHSGDVFYSAERRKWIFWNGRFWEWDIQGKVIDLAEDVLMAIYQEASVTTEKKLREALAKHALKTEARRQIEAMLVLAQSRPEIRTDLSRFDRDSYLFNAANVTIDLRTGKPREFRREDYLTRASPTVYDPQACCPLFDGFMDAVTLSRPALAQFIQRAAGYSTTGATREQCIFILHGPGGNGKSTLALTLSGVWGESYTQQIKAEILCQTKTDSSRDYHLAELIGVRVALACETELRRRLASALVKQWTGGEPLVGRRPFEMPIRFTPIAKLWFSTNHLPKIDDTTVSIWRRLYVIPFDARFEQKNREKGYEEKLLPEASGILNWIIEGCLEWRKRELSPSDVVLERTKRYREEEDLIESFIKDKCMVDPEEWIRFAELYQAYVVWCESEGEAAQTATAFGRALDEKGYTLSRFNAIRGRDGLRLR